MPGYAERDLADLDLMMGETPSGDGNSRADPGTDG
jgi:hypothetical protein